MYLQAVGVARPPRRYTQPECWEIFQGTEAYHSLRESSRELLGRVLRGENGIETRRFAVDSVEKLLERDVEPDYLHAQFSRHAPLLAQEAAAKALDEAGLPPEAVDAVVVSTCTGYLCPGLSTYLLESLPLKADCLALDLVGHGCAAALPNLKIASALIDSGAARHVLSVCVEISSAAFYLDDDPGVLISSCLFGDGAAAAICAATPAKHARAVRWSAYHGRIDPSEREALRFETRGGKLRNILTPPVPLLAGRAAGRIFAEMCQARGVGREAISAFVLHAGGRNVLAALAARLKLGEADLAPSRDTLREYGNMSSPFVLFVLEEALRRGLPGGLWWMASFGAGFACHAAFLEVEG